MSAPILEIRGVSKRFTKRLDVAGKIAARLGAKIADATVHAVDAVDLTIRRGEVLGLVGESGCGKSTLGRVVAGIHGATEGSIFYEGEDVARMSAARRRRATLAIQMIFQDPFASLNPRLRVEDIIGEAPRVHDLVSQRGLSDYVEEVMTKVGLDPSLKRRYPHQFSGGQRQRIGIARALYRDPDVLVLDEATSALDTITERALMEAIETIGGTKTIVMIAHRLSTVRNCDRIFLLERGRVADSGTYDELLARSEVFRNMAQGSAA